MIRHPNTYDPIYNWWEYIRYAALKDLWAIYYKIPHDWGGIHGIYAQGWRLYMVCNPTYIYIIGGIWLWNIESILVSNNDFSDTPPKLDDGYKKCPTYPLKVEIEPCPKILWRCHLVNKNGNM